VIAVYRRADLPAAEPRPLTLALWRVADPGNLGTLIRTADAFGAAVALSAGCADPTGPKALRAAAGSIWRVPIVDFEGAAGKRVALTSGGGTPLADLDLQGDIVFLLGAEREGLPDELARDVDAWIPITRAESLNVGVAGSIALYEWSRQNP
jgi:RNA methyltransferase, TrmH family